MKCVVIDHPFGIASIKLVERPEPGPLRAGQVLVGISAGSLNYRDVLVANGTGRWAPPAGRILGSDGAGVVLAVGADVAWPRMGDRVIGAFLPRWIDGPATPEKMVGSFGGAVKDGVFAQYVVMDAASAVAAPRHMSDAEAAALVCAGVTAWQALTKADSLRPDRTIVVQGTGSVSLLALQIAAAAGARVIVTSSSDAKLERARRLGATACINYSSTPDWAQEVVGLTNGTGADHVIDVGGAATLRQSIAATAYEGTVSVIGLLGGAEAAIDVAPIFLAGIRLQGIQTGSRNMLDDLARWTETVAFKPAIAASFGFGQAGAAFGLLASQKAVGKICLQAGW